MPPILSLPSPPSDQRRAGGFTLIEAAIVMSILTVAISMFVRTMTSSAQLDPIAREAMLAAEAARSKLEELHSRPFSEVFALYNEDPADDPGGPGSAPGSYFEVEGLAPPAKARYVGRITFPTIGNQLREDSNDAMLGTPRDLNSDGLVDAADHRADCILLPTRVRLEWKSRSGQEKSRQFELYTMLLRL